MTSRLKRELGLKAENHGEGNGSGACGELRMEFGLGAGQEHDLKLALLALSEGGTCDLKLFPVGRCVGKLEQAAATDLEAIVKGRAAGKRVDAETGAGVIDFEKLDGRAGAVLDGGVNVEGVACKSA